VQLAVDQGRAEVVLWALVAVVTGQGEAQVVGRLPAQGAADEVAAGVATVDETVAAQAVEVQAVAQGIGQ